MAIPYTHPLPVRDVVPLEFRFGAGGVVAKVPAETVQGEAEIPAGFELVPIGAPPEDDTVGGGLPTGDTRALYSILKDAAATRFNDEWDKAVESGKRILFEQADYIHRRVGILPRSGFANFGAGATRNHNGAEVGSVIRGGFSVKYKRLGVERLLPMFMTLAEDGFSSPNTSGVNLYDLGIVCTNPAQDIFHIDGFNNVSGLHAVRLVGGKAQLRLFGAKGSGETAYVLKLNVMADGFTEACVVVDGGNPDAPGHTGISPNYLVMIAPDIQTKAAGCYAYKFKDVQTGANGFTTVGGILHGSLKAAYQLINCPSFKFSNWGTAHNVNTLFEIDAKSSVVFENDPKSIIGMQPGDYIVKALNPDGSINAARSIRR